MANGNAAMTLNPVERRLVDLCNHWEDFRTNTAKRLLVWRVPDNAGRLLQCFFEVQKHETPYSTNDLFIVFDAPFENSIQYSRALKEALAGQYDASREDLKQQGITPDWQFTPEQFPDSATGFIQSLCAFGSKHHQTIGHLVAVFLPQNVANNNAFAGWLVRALEAGVSERLRLVVIDFMETPRLAGLVDAGHELVYVDTPPIDALAMAQETFAQEGGVGPAAVFRNFLMGIVTLIDKSSADQVKAKAADAFAFAQKQHWADQEVVIALLVASAFLKEKRFDEAIKIYESARQAALQTVASGHPAGQKLVLQTWFGEAGAHLAAGDVLRASACYDQAASVAQGIPEPVLTIEAFRMAAFCHARLGNRDAAVERGAHAMDFGQRLKPAVRGMTTLPLAAVDLLRVVEPERVKFMEDIKQRLDARIDQLRAAVEQRAAELERMGDVQKFHAVEDGLARKTAHAEQEAAQKLNATAASASVQFRQLFAKGRALLGDPWPLASPVALPRAPQTSQAANAAGVTVS
jgi:tetratricopeptide (TPR) repeat protein